MCVFNSDLQSCESKKKESLAVFRKKAKSKQVPLGRNDTLKSRYFLSNLPTLFG